MFKSKVLSKLIFQKKNRLLEQCVFGLRGSFDRHPLFCHQRKGVVMIDILASPAASNTQQKSHQQLGRPRVGLRGRPVVYYSDFYFIAAKNLYESCTYNQQCSERNPQAFCQELDSRQTQCYCRKGYHAKKAHEIPIRYECVLGKIRNYKPTP